MATGVSETKIMGIPLSTIPAATRARMGLGIATKPTRAKRGTGRHAQAKAVDLADLRARSAADVAFTVQCRTVNPLNRGSGGNAWYVEAGHRKKIREATMAALVGKAPPALPAVVTLTRISPGVLDAHDGLPAALKGIVDELAAWLGCDDGDTSAVTWRYAQRRGKPAAVEVLVSTAASSAPSACTSGPSGAQREAT